VAKYQWDETLSVGIGLVDEQHKMLISKADDVDSSVRETQGPRAIASTLLFLIDYTKYHFATEENLMEATGYPALVSHVKAHKELIATLTDLVRDFNEEGATQALAHALNTFLNNWLYTHIKGTDVLFGKFLKERGVEFKPDPKVVEGPGVPRG